jgi:hypothetical protein
VYLEISYDFTLVKLISAFAQFLLEIAEFILIRNTSIVWEKYFVKQEYFNF